jgi:hypothetical protein
LAISHFRFDPGISTLLNFAFPAFRMRVNISATVSLDAILLSVYLLGLMYFFYQVAKAGRPSTNWI